MHRYSFSGTSRQIGEQHGEALREDIKANLGLYLHHWQKTLGQLPCAVQGYRQSISTIFPHLAQEIEGIASASNQSLDAIYAINCRTELLYGVSIPECTSIGISALDDGSKVMGQNWDWMAEFQGLAKIVSIEQADKPKMLFFLEPGMVGKIGMNEDGIGVCLNYLESPHISSEGIPVHVMLRAIAEQTTQKRISRLIESTQRAAGANYLVGTPEGFVDYETTADEVFELFGNDGFIVHTNSYSSKGDLCARQETMRQALKSSTKMDIEALKKLFTLPGIEFPISKPNEVGTINTIFMDLSRQEMHVSYGASSRDYSSFRI